MLLKHERESSAALSEFTYTRYPAQRRIFENSVSAQFEASRRQRNQDFNLLSRITTNNTNYAVPPVRYLPCGMGMVQSLERYSAGDENTWFDSDSKRGKLMELSAPAIEIVLANRSSLENLDKYTHQLAGDFPAFLDSSGFRYGLREYYFASTFAKGGDLKSHTLPGFRYFGEDENIVLFVSLIVLDLMSGGWHLTAWKFNFPTKAESILWKVSCFVGILSPSLTALLLKTSKHANLLILRLILVSIILGVLISARLFLIVESFISLRHVPIGVYAAVPWVQNIPHV